MLASIAITPIRSCPAGGGGGGVPLGIFGGGGGGGGGGDTPVNSWWECAAQFSKSWTYFKPKSVIFLTHFQTCPLINKLCHYYLGQNANKKIS